MSGDDIYRDKIVFFEKEIERVEENIQKHTSFHYNTLVNLHRKINGHKESFDQLKPKIENLENKLHVSQDGIEGYIQQTQEYIATMLKIKSNVTLLSLFMRSHQTFEKLESLVNTYFSTYELDTLRLDLLDRASLLINKLYVYEFKVKDLLGNKVEKIPFFEALSPRIESIKKSLKSVLDAVILEAYQCQLKKVTFSLHAFGKVYNTEEIIHLVLSAYDNMDAHTYFIEKVFIKQIYNKGILKDIPYQKFNGVSKNDMNASTCIFDPIKKWLEGPVSTIIKAANEIRPKKFKIVVLGIWAPLLDKLNTHVARLYDLSIPLTMKRNHATSMEFIAYLEALCGESHVESFRNHSSYQSFMKKWNLQSFFYLRYAYLTFLFELY